jgi:hypothetical protein
MAVNVNKVPLKESNNHPQGKSGSKVPIKKGPATGRRGHVNPTKRGGIYRPTKSG